MSTSFSKQHRPSQPPARLTRNWRGGQASPPLFPLECPVDEIKEPLLNYWYRALASAYGIEISCSDTEAIRSRLYAVRREARDEDLDGIVISNSPWDGSKLWLRKKEKPDEA